MAASPNEVNDELADLPDIWCDLVSRLGHELRTPLASAQMLGDLLAGELPEARRDRYGRQLAEVLADQRRLLAEVVELAMLSASRSCPEAVTVDGDALLEQIADALRKGLEGSTVVLSMPGRGVLPRLETDPQWVAAVARAAAESSQAAGAAALLVEADAGDGVILRFLDDGDTPTGKLAELFRPFSRGRRTTTPAGSASLRLATAFWRCRRLGGSLAADPSPSGPGLCLTLRLPLASR